jgi:hypothetical protein
VLALSAFVVVAIGRGSAAEPAGVRIEPGKDEIQFHIGDERVGAYRIGPDIAKPYLWPLQAPGGVPITRAWPIEKGQPGEATTDHVHHRSLWFCHGDVIPEGIELKQKVKDVEGVDFWSENPGHGRIVCVEVGKPTIEKNRGTIVTRNEWRTADGAKVLDETRTLALADCGAARLFVFAIDLHASTTAITFGDTKEGSFGVRVHDALREKNGGRGKIENADGKTGEWTVWGRPSDWCDYSGPIDGKTVGVAIFDDPANRPRACWHSRGYGLMAANPFGRGMSFPAMKGRTDLCKLAQGEHLKLRYGVLLHSGDAKEGQVAEHFARFAKPD